MSTENQSNPLISETSSSPALSVPVKPAQVQEDELRRLAFESGVAVGKVFAHELLHKWMVRHGPDSKEWKDCELAKETEQFLSDHVPCYPAQTLREPDAVAESVDFATQNAWRREKPDVALIARMHARELIRNGARYFRITDDVSCDDARMCLENYFLRACEDAVKLVLSEHSNVTGAPTGVSAESGSVVSVEGQTDEGLWSELDVEIHARGPLSHPIHRNKNIAAAHNAAITKRQQVGQTDEEIARDAADKIFYLPPDEYDAPAFGKIILAALRAKSEKEEK